MPTPATEPDIEQAAPLVTVAHHGTDPRRRAADLGSTLETWEGTILAAASIGATARRVLDIVRALGGVATRDEILQHTAAAPDSDVDDAIARLVGAKVMQPITDKLVVPSRVDTLFDDEPTSYGDNDTITSNDLSRILKRHGLRAPSNRKGDKIQTLAQYFASEAGQRAIAAELSAGARELLSHIADHGPGRLDINAIFGEGWYLVSRQRPTPFRSSPEVLDEHQYALWELLDLGIIGLVEWSDRVWIWSEAWPASGQPLYTDWPSVEPPPIVAADDTQAALPNIVAALHHMLTGWPDPAPKALKNNEARLSVADNRRLAKAIGQPVELVSATTSLLIEIGLLARVETGASGRGRRRTVTYAWRPEPELLAAWQRLAPSEQWLRLCHQLCTIDINQIDHVMEGASTALTIWTLGALEPGTGYQADDTELAAWLAHTHGFAVTSETTLAALAMLRGFGIVMTDGPVRLTPQARQAATDLDAVRALDAKGARNAYVQSDLTVVATDILDPLIEADIARFATPDSEATHPRYRLDEQRIAQAIADGATSDEITNFLAELSPVPLPDTVTRLIDDAARTVGRVIIARASTVVVFAEPSDLRVAMSLKSNKLTAISDTVAVTEVDAEKIRANLQRKSMAPTIINGSTDPTPAPTTRSERAAALRARAEVYGNQRDPNSVWAQHAASLLEQADQLVDVDGHLQITRPPLTIPR